MNNFQFCKCNDRLLYPQRIIGRKVIGGIYSIQEKCPDVCLKRIKFLKTGFSNFAFRIKFHEVVAAVKEYEADKNLDHLVRILLINNICLPHGNCHQCHEGALVRLIGIEGDSGSDRYIYKSLKNRDLVCAAIKTTLFVNARMKKKYISINVPLISF